MIRFLFTGIAFLFLFFLGSPSLGQEDLPGVVKRIEPSIVVILTYNQIGNHLGQGSGFFVNANGDVITNLHVLEGASRAEIKTYDGKVYPVEKVLAEDREGDLVRVSTHMQKEYVKPLALSRTFPDIGEHIAVIGTPFGLEKTVSDGIVSAIREIPDFGKIIQVTAPISPGSSGSPVINMRGEAIGVATFFVLAGQNLNFAIPVERVAKLSGGPGMPLAEKEKERAEASLVSAERLYGLGLRYLWADEFQKALFHFMEAVKINPNHGSAYFQIGFCMGKLGQYPQAVLAYREALRIKPRDPETHNNLCAALGKIGRYSEAVESCKVAIGLQADLAEAHNNLGWAFFQLNRYEDAIESCKRAIRIKPDFPLAHYNLGNVHLALKQYSEAMESYKQAIRTKFDYPEAHLNLGAAYHGLARYEEAVESYRRALQIKPDFAEAHLDLGMTYLRLGDRGSALEEYKILKDLNREMANRLFNLIYE